MKFKCLLLVLLLTACTTSDETRSIDIIEECLTTSEVEYINDIEVTINNISTKLILYDN